MLNLFSGVCRTQICLALSLSTRMDRIRNALFRKRAIREFDQPLPQEHSGLIVCPSNGQTAKAQGYILERETVETHLSHSSAAARSQPPAKRIIAFKKRNERAAKAKVTEDHTKATAKATERAVSSSPSKETETHRQTCHMPGEHDQLFHESKDSYHESYEENPREEGEVAQPPRQEEVSNPLDERQDNYLFTRRSLFPLKGQAPTRRGFEGLEAAQQRNRRYLQEAQSNLACQRNRIRSFEVELGIGRSADPSDLELPQSSLRQEVKRHDGELYDIHARNRRRGTYGGTLQVRNDVLG
ncbi:hypothetical protein BBJ28_00017789 [Nothophytophthora sp. Chile5]|nr:hypothetical protein BBJ28_00017789 [Nothophytophthora sp. Chile5]